MNFPNKKKPLFQNRLQSALVLLFVVLFFGVVGFRFIAHDYTWTEAVYMTIITVSTVGFGEVHNSTDSTKLFTIILIISSISIYAYVVSVLTEHMANGKIFERLKRKKMQKIINNFENHIIVCGFGRNGKQAVQKLMSFDKKCIVIELDDIAIAEIEELGYTHIKGNATEDKILELANIKKASHLITAMPSDADNLFVVLSARQLNPNLKIISRAGQETSISKLKFAGADNIIMPDKIGGNHMASLIVTPDLVEFVERLSISGNQDTNLEEIAVNNLPKEFINKTLLDLNLRKKTGCSVIGFKNSRNEYTINPDVQTILEPNSQIIVLGKPEQIKKLQEIF